MTDINNKILSMIVNNYSNDQICNELKISKKQLRNRIESIKQEGFNITKSYNYDGTQSFIFNKKFIEDEAMVTIDGDLCGKGFKALAISDTHIGNHKSNMAYVDAIYNYCIEKNINIIFHGGDLFDGSIQYSKSMQEQLEDFIVDYPKEENILTFLAFGNHEETFLTKYGINLKNVIEKYRDDVVPLGYGETPIKLANIKDSIVMCHCQRNFELDGVRLCGHSHRYRFFADDYNPQITIPTLSDYLHTCDYPGAVELFIEPCNEKIRYLMLKHLIINESGKIKTVSQIEHKSCKSHVRNRI